MLCDPGVLCAFVGGIFGPAAPSWVNINYFMDLIPDFPFIIVNPWFLCYKERIKKTINPRSNMGEYGTERVLCNPFLNLAYG